MKAIDNTGILDICGNCSCQGFTPGLTWSYNAGAGTITVTDASEYPSGDDLTIVHVNVTDKHGGIKYGKIEAAAGNVVIDVSGLNKDGGFNLRVTIVTDGRCTADLAAYDIAAYTATTGELGTPSEES